MASIPGQGACLGCGFDSQPRLIQEATDPCFSLASMSLPSSLSKSNEKMSSGEDFKNRVVAIPNIGYEMAKPIASGNM